MRLVVAFAVIAVAWSSAVYIHQRHDTGRTGQTSNIFDSPAARHQSWQDPAAIVIAIAGLAMAAAIVTVRRR